jgi:hypothetical protein
LKSERRKFVSSSEEENGNETPGFNEDVQSNSEALADGEAIGELEGATSESTSAVAVQHTGAVSLLQSDLRNPYMSEEDQQVEMKPAVVGPPAYGSPDPASQAGRLVPIADHPLAPENAPEGAEISDDYGTDVQGLTTTATTATAPLTPMTDLERDTSGLGGGSVPTDDEGNPNYDELTVVQLKEEASRRGIEGTSSMNKGDLIEALESDDDENTVRAEQQPA